MIASKFQTKLFNTIAKRVATSDLQTWRDTEDMTRYSHQIFWNDAMKYVVLFPLAMCWRIYSNGHFWNALRKVGAVSLTSTPVWTKFRPVMEMFRARGESFYVGLFYCGNKLQRFRYDVNDRWQCCTACNMDDIDRLIVAMQIVWYVADLMNNNFQELQQNPTRAAWETCTKSFLQAIQARANGMFSHYSLKKCLDAILITQPKLEKFISYWPMRCPAYISFLPRLYPGIQRTQDQLYKAACHYHKTLKKTFPKFRLNESLAQLCWLERGVS